MPTTLQDAPTRFLGGELEKTKLMFQNADFELARTTFDRALVVSSDSAMQEQLNRVLAKRNHIVRNMGWHELVPTCLQDDISVVLLDASGDPDELVLCRKIRRINDDMPIISDLGSSLVFGPNVSHANAKSMQRREPSQIAPGPGGSSDFLPLCPPNCANINTNLSNRGAVCGGSFFVTTLYTLCHSSSAKITSHNISPLSRPKYVIYMTRHAMIS